MRQSRLLFSFTIALLLLAACSSEPEPATQEQAPAASSTPTSDASANPSGTWTGDWGPSETHRNNVTMELQWNGSSLTGTINPDQSPVTLMNTSYDPATGTVMMEADVSRGASTVHYMIQGKIEGNAMTGTWKHEKGQGEFRVMKS